MVIVVASLVIKLLYVGLVGGGLDLLPSEGTDTSYYHTTAINLLEIGIYGHERGVPTVGMPPGEPAFLALLYAVSGRSFAFAKIAHILLLTAAAVLTFLTGRALFGNAIGFGAGMLLAVDPGQAYLSATFLSEPLFIFLMTLGIYLLVRERANAHPAWLVGAGLCFGLAGLTRNQGWLFVLFLAGGAVFTAGRLMPIRSALLLLIVTAVVIAPWTWRNYTVTGEFVPVSVEGGLTLWASNNPEFEWRQPMPMTSALYERPAGLAGTEVDHYYRQKALDWIAANPGTFVLNGIRKVIVLYHFDPMSARPEMADLFRWVGLIPYGIMLPFILLGLALNRRDRRLWLIYAYILFTTLLAVVFWGDSRIRAPIQPYLYLFGALSAAWAIKGLKAHLAQEPLAVEG